MGPSIELEDNKTYIYTIQDFYEFEKKREYIDISIFTEEEWVTFSKQNDTLARAYNSSFIYGDRGRQTLKEGLSEIHVRAIYFILDDCPFNLRGNIGYGLNCFDEEKATKQEIYEIVFQLVKEKKPLYMNRLREWLYENKEKIEYYAESVSKTT